MKLLEDTVSVPMGSLVFLATALIIVGIALKMAAR